MKSFCGSVISLFFYLSAFFLLPTAVLCRVSSTLDPRIAVYSTELPHNQGPLLSISLDGKSAYRAFLDTTRGSIFVQRVDPSTAIAVGGAVEISGARQAGGLVAQNDGFAILTTAVPSAEIADASPEGYPVEIIRYKGGIRAWAVSVNGLSVHDRPGSLSVNTDIKGALFYSGTAGLYTAYLVVPGYTDDTSGSVCRSVQYVDDFGEPRAIAGASGVWSCSQDTTGSGVLPLISSIRAEDRGSVSVINVAKVTRDATRTFRNIATITNTASSSVEAAESTEVAISTSTAIPVPTETSTTTTSSSDLATSTSSTTNTDTTTGTEVETSIETPASTDCTASSLSGATSDALPTRKFRNTTTVTELTTTRTTTSTDAETSIDPPTTPTSTPTTSSADFTTPISPTTTTTTMRTILTVTVTKVATVVAPSVIRQPHPPTPTARAWDNCENGAPCASGHRCIVFRGVVAVCVPRRGRYRKHKHTDH